MTCRHQWPVLDTLDAEHYADHLYGYGLFAYLLTLEGYGGKPPQTFTVVSHYVE